MTNNMVKFINRNIKLNDKLTTLKKFIYEILDDLGSWGTTTS